MAHSTVQLLRLQIQRKKRVSIKATRSNLQVDFVMIFAGEMSKLKPTGETCRDGVGSRQRYTDVLQNRGNIVMPPPKPKWENTTSDRSTLIARVAQGSRGNFSTHLRACARVCVIPIIR